jgi:succinoglycan biosynthesis transport protein ExoP
MDLRQFVRVLRTQAWLILVVIAVFAAGAIGFDSARRPLFAAETQLFVSTSGAPADLSQTYQGGLFAQQRVQSYAQIVDSPVMVQRIISQLRLKDSVRDLQGEISASVPVDTVLIDITVTDRSAVRAKSIANALAARFPGFIAALERSKNRSPSPVAISVTSPAELPTHPVSPKRAVDLGIALVLGLVVGVGGALLRDALDTRVHGGDVATAVVAAPIVGTIIFDRNTKSRPLAVADSRSKRAEDFRRLRTNIRVGEGFRSFVVSSAVASEGKTTVVANLGVALAQAGYRVVLVDADLRHPKLGALFGVASQVGLGDVLTGGVEMVDALRRWRDGLHLEILPAGTIPSNPSELLGSERLPTMLHKLVRRCDIILFDSPALLEVTDAAVVGKMTSGVLLVTRPSITRVDELESAVESLRAADADVFGLILNGMPSRDRYRPRAQPAGGSNTDASIPVPSRRGTRVARRPRRAPANAPADSTDDESA